MVSTQRRRGRKDYSSVGCNSEAYCTEIEFPPGLQLRLIQPAVVIGMPSFVANIRGFEESAAHPEYTPEIFFAPSAPSRLSVEKTGVFIHQMIDIFGKFHYHLPPRCEL